MSSQKYNFTDKVALVTGSSSGIGAATAIQFARYGANVTVTGRDSSALAKVAEEVKKVSGKEPLQLVGDLANDDFVEKLVAETVEKFGRLDFLVNNAGGGTPVGALKDPEILDEFDRVMRVNVRSVVKLTQLAIPHLETTKGNVVNISSVVSVKPYALVYCTSKAALDMVTKCSAQELGPKGIRVNSVNPGPVKTGFGRSVGAPTMLEDNHDEIIKYTVLGRIASSDDIANMILFLASDNDSANVTGSIMFNDGGCLVK